jgi:hypothetical protein
MSLILRVAVTQGPFITFTVPNQFRYMVGGQEPGSFSGALITDCFLRKEHSVKGCYFTVTTHGFEVKCHIFQLFMDPNFTCQSVYFYISD